MKQNLHRRAQHVIQQMVLLLFCSAIIKIPLPLFSQKLKVRGRVPISTPISGSNPTGPYTNPILILRIYLSTLTSSKIITFWYCFLTLVEKKEGWVFQWSPSKMRETIKQVVQQWKWPECTLKQKMFIHFWKCIQGNFRYWSVWWWVSSYFHRRVFPISTSCGANLPTLWVIY